MLLTDEDLTILRGWMRRFDRTKYKWNDMTQVSGEDGRTIDGYLDKVSAINAGELGEYRMYASSMPPRLGGRVCFT
jgi:hypothetical protein